MLFSEKVINRYLGTYSYCLMVVFKGWFVFLYRLFIPLKNPIKSPLSFLCNYKSPPLFLRSMKENYYCPVKISTILYLTQIHQVASVLQKGACLFVLCKIGSTKHKKAFRRHLYK